MIKNTILKEKYQMDIEVFASEVFIC